jgi:MFS family permease
MIPPASRSIDGSSTAFEDAAREAREASAPRLGLLAFAHMLPATMLSPAIRPLFAALHPGRDGALHAFFAVHMIGGMVAAPLAIGALRRGVPARALFVALAAIDAALLLAFAAPIGTSALLVARVIDGAAHVAASTLLLAIAASPSRARSAVPTVSFGIMGAVAIGSVLGALLVGLSPRAPFRVASALMAMVACGAASALGSGAVVTRARPRAWLSKGTLPFAIDALIARLQVGALIVSYALLAHRAHGLDDRTIGRHFALVTVPFALATGPLARFGQRRGARGLGALGLVVVGAVTAPLGWIPTRALPYAMSALGLASAAIFAALVAEASSAGDELARARRMAVLNAAGCAGMLLGPTLAGVLAAVARSASDPARGQRLSLLACGALVLGWGLARVALGRARRSADEAHPCTPASASSSVSITYGSSATPASCASATAIDSREACAGMDTIAHSLPRPRPH